MVNTYFPRCSWGHPENYARCWLPPGHTGKHLILRPGERPAAASVLRIVVSRPDMLVRDPVARNAFLLRLAAEPLGLSTEFDAFLLDGSALAVLRGDPNAAIDAFQTFVERNLN